MLRDSEPRSDRRTPTSRLTTIGTILIFGLSLAGFHGFAMQTASAADAAIVAQEELPSVTTDPTADGIDLSYVPSNAIGFVAIRPKAILKHAELADLVKTLQQRMVDDKTGFSPTGFEQITLVLLGPSEKSLAESPSRPSISDGLLIVRMAKAENCKWFREFFKGYGKREHRGKTYLRGDFVSSYWPDDRTFVEGWGELAVKAFIDAQSAPPPGLLGLPKFVDAKQWKTFQSDQAVLAIDVKSAVAADWLSGLIPADAISVLSRETKLVLAGVHCGDEMRGHAVFAAENEEAAKNLAAFAEANRISYAAALVKGRRSDPSNRQTYLELAENWARRVGESLLKAAKVEQKGTLVCLQGQVAMATIAKPPAAADAIVEGVGWKDVRVDMKREDLLKVLGKPDNDPASNWLKWADKHIDCTFYTGASGVSEVRFNPGFTAALANGVKLGGPDTVLKLYGEANFRIERPNGAKEFEYSRRGILLWTHQGKVTQIVVFKPYVLSNIERRKDQDSNR